MAFGVHILILRFLGDRVGVERVEPGLVARRLPRGVARERTAVVLAVGEDLLRVAFAVGQCRHGIPVELGEQFGTGDRPPRPNRREDRKSVVTGTRVDVRVDTGWLLTL